MNLKGSERLPGSPEAVWEVLFDPEMIAATIPGCRSLVRVGEDEYVGQVDLRFGPFSQQFDARFAVEDKDYPRSYRLIVEAAGSGLSVRASTKVSLEEEAGGTQMAYESTAQMSGALSSFGPLGESVARMLVTQGLADLRQKVEQRLG